MKTGLAHSGGSGGASGAPDALGAAVLVGACPGGKPRDASAALSAATKDRQESYRSSGDLASAVAMT